MKKILMLLIAIVAVCILWVYLKYGNHRSLLPVTSPASFSFAVEADPHMDEQSDDSTYTQTLQQIVKANPSFLIDLGDIFMVDKLQIKSDTNITKRYELMKSYYNQLQSIPLYFAMGNHDGETGWDKLNTKSYRRAYFPDETKDKNYFSFEKVMRYLSFLIHIVIQLQNQILMVGNGHWEKHNMTGFQTR